MHITSIVAPDISFKLNRGVNYVSTTRETKLIEKLIDIFNKFAYSLGHRVYSRKFKPDIKGNLMVNFEHNNIDYPLKVVDDKLNSIKFNRLHKLITSERANNNILQYPLLRAYVPTSIIQFGRHTDALYHHLSRCITSSHLYNGISVYQSGVEIPITNVDCTQTLINLKSYEYAELIEDGNSVNVLKALQEIFGSIFEGRYSNALIDIRRNEARIDSSNCEYSLEDSYFMDTIIDLLSRAFVLTDPKHRNIDKIKNIEGIVLLYHDNEKFMGNYRTVFNDAYINLFTKFIPKYFPNIQIIVFKKEDEN